MNTFRESILRTLLYYDIFEHPLNSDEMFYLFPKNSITKSKFKILLSDYFKEHTNGISFRDNFYFVGKNFHYVDIRKHKEQFSKKAWRAARLMTHIIKRFPFVRGVFVTGTLSKNGSLPGSDLDFMVVTKSNRLWICRTLLMLFKKVFLFNSYKYFCINYFVSEDSLEIEEKNIFTATEIAHIKSTYNSRLMHDFIKANSWIKKYFPNYGSDAKLNFTDFKVNNRESKLQKLIEFPFTFFPSDRLDKYFRKITIDHWKNRFPDVEENEREHMFKSTNSVSKAHPGNMQKVILSYYKDRLKKFDLDYNE